MNRKILALLVTVILCRTAYADLFYAKDSSLGHLIEDSSGNFQEGPVVTNLLNENQGLIPIKYKGRSSWLFFDTYKSEISYNLDDSHTHTVSVDNFKSFRIYDIDNFDTPITSCDISSRNMRMSWGLFMRGDNILCAGTAKSNAEGIIECGILEINPETGEVVNQYLKQFPADNTLGATCIIELCNNKIYALFNTLNAENDFMEMSELGVITNNFSELDGPIPEYGLGLPDVKLYSLFKEIGGDLYLEYTIMGEVNTPTSKRPFWGEKIVFPKEFGILRFNDDVSLSTASEVAKINYTVTNDKIKGSSHSNSYILYSDAHDGNGGIFFYTEDFTAEDALGSGLSGGAMQELRELNVYYADNTGNVSKIYNAGEFKQPDYPDLTSIETYINSMYYDTANKKLFLSVSKNTLEYPFPSIEQIEAYTEPEWTETSKLVILSRNSDDTFSVSQEIEGISDIVCVDASPTPNNPSDQSNPLDTNAQSSESSSGGCNLRTGAFAILLLISAFKFQNKQ